MTLGWAKIPAMVTWLSMQELFQIVHETDDLLVINKPAGLVCHPTKGDQYSSLISRVRIYLGEGISPQMVNRLDRETSGILLIAKNSQTALELRRIWESRAVAKRYLAIVHGQVTQPNGSIQAALGKDVQSQVAIKHCVRADGAPAQTDFLVLGRFVRDETEFSLLRVEPRTGRKHQIRIHLAHIGHPVVGDKLYGGDEDLYLAFVQYRLTAAQQSRLLLHNQALHAEEVEFVWNGETRIFRVKPEPSFMAFAGLAEWSLSKGVCVCENWLNPKAAHPTAATSPL
jgi:23S rRNA pseudouridine1911/1915/1917 synthase